jgi:hypothetical protein
MTLKETIAHFQLINNVQAFLCVSLRMAHSFSFLNVQKFVNKMMFCFPGKSTIFFTQAAYITTTIITIAIRNLRGLDFFNQSIMPIDNLSSMPTLSTHPERCSAFVFNAPPSAPPAVV